MKQPSKWKTVAIFTSSQKLPQCFSALCGHILDDKEASSIFKGAIIDLKDQNSLNIKMIFDHGANQDDVVSIVKKVFHFKTKLNVQLVDMGFSIDLEENKNLNHVWEIRQHTNGRLLVKTQSKKVLQHLIHWIPNRMFWDLLVIKEGYWEKSMKCGQAIAFGTYPLAHVQDQAISHTLIADKLPREWEKFMGRYIDGGMTGVHGIYFGNKEGLIDTFQLSMMIDWKDTDESTASLTKLVEFESLHIAKDQFIRKYLGDAPTTGVEFQPEVQFVRSRGTDKLQTELLRSSCDLQKISRDRWLNHIFTDDRQKQDRLLFNVKNGQDNSPNLPFRKFAFVSIPRESLSLFVYQFVYYILIDFCLNFCSITCF